MQQQIIAWAVKDCADVRDLQITFQKVQCLLVHDGLVWVLPFG